MMRFGRARPKALKRRRFLASAPFATLSGSRAASAQDKAIVPNIGYLGIEHAAGPHPELDAFLDGLRDLGYVEGRTIRIEYRMVGYDEAQLDKAARELVAQKVAVIVAFQPSFRAAIAATRTIPIVIRATNDPVKAGYAASLAHPGGNVTGVSSASAALYRKRVELLADLLPNLRRVAILSEPGASDAYRDEVIAACRERGLTALPLAARSVEELDRAIAIASSGADALVPVRSPLIVSQRTQIARLVAARRLPTIYDDRAFVLAGGLIAYGANLAALHRRAAYYVDRILRGAAAGDLPIEEPTVFELVVSRKAADGLGLKLSPSILARADEVIE